MKLCQGPICHEYKTKDRIRGSKGSKRYETRRRSSFYYAKGNFCSMICQDGRINKHIEHALDHFGRTTQVKHVVADSAWYKSVTYIGYRNNGGPNYNHFFVNDLLGQRIPITQQQYADKNLTTPTV